MNGIKKAAFRGERATYQTEFTSNYITGAPDIEGLLSRLDGVRSYGDGKWMAVCPAHKDSSPSLSIRLVDDRKILLLHDFGGCGVEEVLAAVGLEMSDLFPRQDGRNFDATQPRTPPPRFRAAELLELAAFEARLVALAALDLARGVGLGGDDLARVCIAANTLEALVREVSR